MSYEGYEEFFCKAGHRTVYNCYDAPDRKDWVCPICACNLAVWHSVDQTNGGDNRLNIPMVKGGCCAKCGSEERFPPVYDVSKWAS